MSAEVTDAEVDAFVAAAADAVALHGGPLRARRLYEFAGYNHDHPERSDCYEACPSKRGMLVWLRAVGALRLINARNEGSDTDCWRPLRADEPFVRTSFALFTPEAAELERADADEFDRLLASGALDDAGDIDELVAADLARDAELRALIDGESEPTRSDDGGLPSVDDDPREV